jgi:ATP-dependent exoDNAse (exonuclease V) beta subunit
MNKLDPPDRNERLRALDPARSILVQAPAGSGKTQLLTDRFIALLGEVDEPGQVVAITFTNAAAAEMRHRILDELAKPQPSDLARRVLERSNALGWNLLELPAQLRITTIDAFCRELALQQPLLSGLGGALEIAEQPRELYRRAARATLREIDGGNRKLSDAIAALLEWHDNDWRALEELLVEMLSKRDRWMQGFVLDREPDEAALRARLERPFARAVHEALTALSHLLNQLLGAGETVLRLARFACEHKEGEQFHGLAELAEFPVAPFNDSEELEAARQAYIHLSKLLLTDAGEFRKQVNIRIGFPADRKPEKAQLLALIEQARTISGFESALAAVRALPPARYTDDDWRIVFACFNLLRHTVGQLRIAFAETGTVDYTEVAQIAQQVLRGPDGEPTDAALAIADNIRHLLVDEFQDTSRRQHQLLSSLIAAWPERNGRTCFAVGDPMQSIYFFRDADAELFGRVRDLGLEIPAAEPLVLDSVTLRANFRTEPALVEELNRAFAAVFAADDNSGVGFSAAEPARERCVSTHRLAHLHLEFAPQIAPGKAADPRAAEEKQAAQQAQIAEIVALIRSHQKKIEEAALARAHDKEKKYRIAVLGRARSHLIPIAEALRSANHESESRGEKKIPFRAVELENLSARTEVRDALSLARALLNPQDRVAWLGVLRAPWCGLSLKDLHLLVSADDLERMAQPVPELLSERQSLLSEEARISVVRVLDAYRKCQSLRASHPTATLGTWLEEIWVSLGGAQCVDQTERANLDALWSFLDQLPDGDESLFSPGFEAALDRFTAQPDPDAGSDCGVQLMTIHKSKGLEFEVVILPELQASDGRGKGDLLSWLERGLERELAEPDESGGITEFLVAPKQSRGTDRGVAKAWVDRVYRERETQEMRRILYVAATRAREELHLFARPAYKTDVDGELSLAEPKGSLLATAWPALEAEVRSRFEDWKSARKEAVAPLEMEIESIAAAGQSNLLEMPGLPRLVTEARPTLLRRLPANYGPEQTEGGGFRSVELDRAGTGTSYLRHEGGTLSRVFGTAVHALLEGFSKLRANNDWEASSAALMRLEPRVAAQIRAAGVTQDKAVESAALAIQTALKTADDPIGRCILSPHAEAASELRWTGLVAGTLRTVQVDRVFRAGLTPGAAGEEAWWIIDYKTAHAENIESASALPELRRYFAPQLEAYAAILRNLHGTDAKIHAGLYYPRMSLFDWWEL